MKNFIYVFIVFVVSGMTLSAQTSWTDVANMNPTPEINPGGPNPNPPAMIPATGVDFYTDADMFLAACPNGRENVEDFENANNPAGVCSGLSPLNEATDDGCISAGEIISGFDFEVIDVVGPPVDYAHIGTGFLGSPSGAAGPNTFGDDSRFVFNVPVTGASFKILGLFNSGAFQVEVFGASGSLGTVDLMTNGTTEVFVGVVASEDITMIEVTDAGSGALAELYTELTFGACEIEIVPTLGEWAIICLGMMMLIIGVVAVGQKEMAIA